MKKTITEVRYFCDRCGEMLSEHPDESTYMMQEHSTRTEKQLCYKCIGSLCYCVACNVLMEDQDCFPGIVDEGDSRCLECIQFEVEEVKEWLRETERRIQKAQKKE